MNDQATPAKVRLTDLLGPLLDSEEDPARLWAEIHRLRTALQGPIGFATWQETATAERMIRVQFQHDALRFRFLADRAVLVAIDRDEQETVLTVEGGPHQICGVALTDAVDEAMRA